MPFADYFAHVWRGTTVVLRGPAGSGAEGTLADLLELARELQAPTRLAPETLAEARHGAVSGARRRAAGLRAPGAERLGPRARAARREDAALDRLAELSGDVRPLRPERHVPLGRPRRGDRARLPDRPRVRRLGRRGVAAARGRGAGTELADSLSALYLRRPRSWAIDVPARPGSPPRSRCPQPCLLGGGDPRFRRPRWRSRALQFPGHHKRGVTTLSPPSSFVDVVRRNQLAGGNPRARSKRRPASARPRREPRPSSGRWAARSSSKGATAARPAPSAQALFERYDAVFSRFRAGQRARRG